MKETRGRQSVPVRRKPSRKAPKQSAIPIYQPVPSRLPTASDLLVEAAEVCDLSPGQLMGKGVKRGENLLNARSVVISVMRECMEFSYAEISRLLNMTLTSCMKSHREIVRYRRSDWVVRLERHLSLFARGLPTNRDDLHYIPLRSFLHSVTDIVIGSSLSDADKLLYIHLASACDNIGRIPVRKAKRLDGRVVGLLKVLKESGLAEINQHDEYVLDMSGYVMKVSALCRAHSDRAQAASE